MTPVFRSRSSLPTLDILTRQFPGHRAHLKRTILATALACFNDHGLEPTTIEMIRERCDTSVGNIYHHFGNKDGLIAALFLCAIEDQAQLLADYIGRATTAREGVAALVHSYVDWVSAQPEFARFQFMARTAVASGPRADELAEKNRARNRRVIAWFAHASGRDELEQWPAELLPSLIVGQSENYCRAWLNGRVKSAPAKYREALAIAAWRSVSK